MAEGFKGKMGMENGSGVGKRDGTELGENGM